MDNFTKAVRFERPDYIPMTYAINRACWHHYDKEALFDLMEEHKLLFPDFVRPAKDWMPTYALVARKDEPYTDPMGCTWVTTDNGITGTVHGHPLDDWNWKQYLCEAIHTEPRLDNLNRDLPTKKCIPSEQSRRDQHHKPKHTPNGKLPFRRQFIL